jgi:atypical dual specificity phosphatase
MNGVTTYVHCKAGRGRSTVVVIAFLMQHRHMSLEDAIAFVKTKRPHVSLHPKQMRILRSFAEDLSTEQG